MFLSMQSKAKCTKENNNEFDYAEIKEFHKIRTSWTQLKGKQDTGKKIAIYLKDNREVVLTL